MIINIRVNSKTKQKKVEQVTPEYYKVWVQAPPEKNKANLEAIEVLATYFNIKKNQIRILKGLESKEKLIEIVEEKVL